MPNLGNAWHLPGNPEPRGRGGMRDPVGAVVAGAALTIRSGNQFAGPGNAADQWQDGSTVFARRGADQDWAPFPLLFSGQVGNNKYFEATIPAAFLAAPDTLSYYLRIAYGGRDTTFVHTDPGGFAVTDLEAAAQAAPFTTAVLDPADVGRWDPVVDLPNVAVHASLLPTGEVLMWGRRLPGNADMHVAGTEPFRWDPVTGVVPTGGIGAALNLFCAGHTHLPDGTLLVAGGHDGADGHGLATAFRYDPALDAWEPLPPMNAGRWYPTATALPDGGVLVVSGSYAAPEGTTNNWRPQVWRNGAWAPVAGLPGDQPFELYPRMHVAPDGSVVMTGPLAGTWWLDPSGTWTLRGDRAAGRRDYAPSVQYRPSRVLYIGGGNDPDTGLPTAQCEILPLDAVPVWTPAAPLGTARRHHNATVLPDGTVLVTGGTRGPGFNDLEMGAPVHEAELWDPTAGPVGSWRTLAAERVDRCYHATATLLPDGRVLSAGGGEFLVNDLPNDPQDTHADAQVFSPPYLFAGARPGIVGAPATVDHAANFTVEVDSAVPVARVSLVRLASGTHAQTYDQRFLWLDATITGTTVTVSAPATAQVCPPGPYLLFVLTAAGLPSVGVVVRVTVPAVAPPALVARGMPAAEPAARAAPAGPAVLVGIDGVCPYGIGACWGGAHEALGRLTGVVAVDPVPDGVRSTAVVHLGGDGLPALDRWADEFAATANGSYRLRGCEMTVAGVLDRRDGRPVLRADGDRPEIGLQPVRTLVAWDPELGAPLTPTASERGAFGSLAVREQGKRIQVTGPITLDAGGWLMQVRALLFPA